MKKASAVKVTQVFASVSWYSVSPEGHHRGFLVAIQKQHDSSARLNTFWFSGFLHIALLIEFL